MARVKACTCDESSLVTKQTCKKAEQGLENISELCPRAILIRTIVNTLIQSFDRALEGKQPCCQGLQLHSLRDSVLHKITVNNFHVQIHIAGILTSIFRYIKRQMTDMSTFSGSTSFSNAFVKP